MGETLTYAPRKAIKSQALADFVIEWTDTQLPPAQVQAELWTMYFDGSLMKIGAGVGLLFISPLDVHIRYVIRIHFATSNNVAEYKALVNGLWIAIELGVRRLDIRLDSQLVIDQVMKASSCMTQKWRLTERRYASWRTSSMASSSFTSHNDTMKRSRHPLEALSPRLHPLEALSPRHILKGPARAIYRPRRGG